VKVGDLVRFVSSQYPPARRGCLPYLEHNWGYGLVQDETDTHGNISVLWPDRGVVSVDNRFLEVVSEATI